MCNGLTVPSLVASFHCGCLVKLETLEAAVAHTRKERHTVTFTGCLSMQNHHSNDPTFPSNCAEVEPWFSCGDGFTSTSFEKACEHVRKTSHVIQVQGRVKKPSLNKRESGRRHHTLWVPTPVESPCGGWRGKKVRKTKKKGDN